MANMQFFAFVILVQLFWSFGVTVITYALPDDQLRYVYLFTDDSAANALNTTAAKVQTNMQNQAKIPAIDSVSLVFYSGNMVLDLILNFFSAIPQMLITLVKIITFFIPIQAILLQWFEVLILVVGTILFLLGFLGTILGLRSGSQVIS